MKINKTGTYQIGANSPPEKSPEDRKKPPAAAEDHASVSAEARSMFEADQSKKLGEVEQRIENGFYFSGSVTAKLVDKLVMLFNRSVSR